MKRERGDGGTATIIGVFWGLVIVFAALVFSKLYILEEREPDNHTVKNVKSYNAYDIAINMAAYEDEVESLKFTTDAGNTIEYKNSSYTRITSESELDYDEPIVVEITFYDNGLKYIVVKNSLIE